MDDDSRTQSSSNYFSYSRNFKPLRKFGLFLSEGILSHTHDDLYTICYLKDMNQQLVNPSSKWIAKLMKVNAKGPFYIFRKTFDESQETYVNAKMNMTIKEFLTLFSYQWKTYELNKNTL